jgi:hypothetical protein
MGMDWKLTQNTCANSEVTRPHGTPSYRRDDNIKMNLKEIWRVSVNWIQLAQVRDQWQAHVITIMNEWVRKKKRNFTE